MDIVTITRDYELVIPRAARERLELAPGQTMQVLVDGDSMVLIPFRPAQARRGFLRGIETAIVRDADRI